MQRLLAQQQRGGAGLLQRRLQGLHVGRHGLAQAQAFLGNIGLCCLVAGDGFQRFGLGGDPCLGDGGAGDACGQVEAGAGQLVAAVVGARHQGLEGALVAARQIELVLHADARAVQAERAPIAGQALRAGRNVLAGTACTEVGARQLGGTLLSRLQLFGLAQLRLRGRQRRAGLQGLGDQRVQAGGAELLPPGRLQVHVGAPRLRRAKSGFAGAVLYGWGRARQCVVCQGPRGLVIRACRAACEQGSQ